MQGVLLLVTGIFTSIQCISALRTAVDVSPTHLSASRFSLDRPPTSRPNSDHVLCMSAVGEATDDPFSRKALLEGATKAAGVIGAGTFLQKGFISGVPYNGKPDLSGKVRFMSHFCRSLSRVGTSTNPLCVFHFHPASLRYSTVPERV